MCRNAGRAHRVCPAVALSGNNFDKAAIRRLNEVIARIFEGDFKFEIGDIPIGQPLGVRRGDSEVLDASEH